MTEGTHLLVDRKEGRIINHQKVCLRVLSARKKMKQSEHRAGWVVVLLYTVEGKASWRKRGQGMLTRGAARRSPKAPAG